MSERSPQKRIRTPEDAYEAGRAACRQRGDHPTPAQCDRIAAILRPRHPLERQQSQPARPAA
jgi:hypothetical protein